MSVPQRLLAEILSAIARAVAEDNREVLVAVHDAIKGAAALPRSEQTKKKSPAPRQASLLAENKLIEESEVVRVFNSFPDRISLENYIAKKAFKKIDLLYIAKLLKVAVYKSDDTDKIAEKIIDATLGYKLRSQTIRGRES